MKERLIPAVKALRDAIAAKAGEWHDIVKIGRTHMQDATPLTLGQEWSGYAGMLERRSRADRRRAEGRLPSRARRHGRGHRHQCRARASREAAAAEIAKLTGLPFVSAPNKFTVQGAHDALVQLSGTLRTLAVSLYKIANDIRLMSCGPRAGFAELVIPANEPGSSIMPGKVNPTQAEALTMIAVQVMANDVAVGFGGAGGYLEMNVYKPLMIFNVTHSITILTDGCTNFRKFLVEGTKPNLKKIKEYVDRSLMLVTALSPVIGYDKASKIAHYAMDNDLTLKAAALKLGFVTEDGVRPRRRSGEDGQALCGRQAVSSLMRLAWPVTADGDRSRNVGSSTRNEYDLGGACQSCPHRCASSIRQRPIYGPDIGWAERLGHTLGLRARIMPRWGELQLQAQDSGARLISAVAADPTGVAMNRVASTMRAIEDLGAGPASTG